MTLLFRSLFLLVLSTAAIAQPQTGETRCHLYGGLGVRLNGTLFSRTVQRDADDHGSNAETVWILKLDSPMCVYEDKKSLAHYPAQANVREVEVILSKEGMAFQASLLRDKMVVATGQLAGSHHYPRVVINAEYLEPKH